MDGQRFDALTRLIGAGVSRRRVLASLTGGVLAGALGRTAVATAVCTPTGSVCGSDLECCGQRCLDEVCIDCVPLDGGCVIAGGVGDALVCCPGLFCDTDSGTCQPLDLGCSAQGESCSGGAGGASAQGAEPCCDGFFCNDDNVCEVICQSDGDACEEDEDCCGELECNGGTCALLCLGDGEGLCGLDEECCGDLVCIGDVCVVEGSCAGSGGACTGDGDCCNGICCGGQCLDIECCTDDEDPNARCPEGSACFEGVCDELGANGANVTVHKATCPTGTADIFGDCHDNALAGIVFTIDVTTVTTDDDGIAGTAVVAGSVTVTEDADTLADYLGAYVYCSEQNSGTVLYDGSADSGSVTFTVADGDEVICDWYNIEEAGDDEEDDEDEDDGGTTLPDTGTGPTTGDATPWLGVAALGAAAAVFAGKRIRDGESRVASEE